MMNMWIPDNPILSAILFFMPGFIFMKVKECIYASDIMDFSKKWYDAVAYSLIFTGTTYLFLLLPVPTWLAWLITFAGLIILPAVVAYIMPMIMQLDWVHKHFLLLQATSWDYIFSKRKSYWMIVHRKNGTVIGGHYDSNSFSSAYPYKKDIFLASTWIVDDNTFEFKEEILQDELPVGAWISAEDISYIEIIDILQGGDKKNEG